jgi:hypothetical protein
MATWDQLIDKVYSKFHSKPLFAFFFDADDNPQAVSQATPMPVAITGNVNIQGDVIVDSVGIDQSAPGVSNGVAVIASVLAEGAATQETLFSVDAKTPALGQALAAASVPVVLPAAQVTALTPPANPDPATATLQATANSSLTTLEAKDFATQATLASVLAKIIAAPATEAKQDAAIVQETAINTVLGEVTASPTPNTLADRLKQLLTGIVLSTGSNVIGAVTQSGSWVLAAGSAIIGKVSIDQTTDGTTNLVAAKQNGTWTVQPGNTANTTAWKVDGSAVTQPVSIATAPVLVAGSAVIGKVGIDQTTPFTTNAVGIVGRVTKTDRSGTITAGATAQTLMAANSSRLGWQLQNNSVGDLWFNELGSTAVANQPSFKLAPGDSYESPVGATTTAAISIIGATTGQAFTAREW